MHGEKLCDVLVRSSFSPKFADNVLVRLQLGSRRLIRSSLQHCPDFVIHGWPQFSVRDYSSLFEKIRVHSRLAAFTVTLELEWTRITSNGIRVYSRSVFALAYLVQLYA